ncbi:universal stress protein [Kitasatospora sp. NPDC059571]|uniref:universal stress protein n=1 Tax=Kitasatospora sp. NPDC059571 TaxID=3346871 RepID=UPI003674935E
MTQGTPARRIVVGVDGSPSSNAALRWAARQAELTGATLDAVIAWEYPASYGWSGTLADGDFGVWAGKALSDAVAAELGAEPAVVVRERVLGGNAATVLLDAAEGADLLVLGNRGRGGFRQALLGSVGQHCVQHADCPVVIVRGKHQDT